jgi:hypothetical protein
MRQIEKQKESTLKKKLGIQEVDEYILEAEVVDE